MIDSYSKTPRPIRDVEVEYSIDQSKCDICVEKPCLTSCPIGAIFLDSNDNDHTKIKSTCFGCVLCRNACPYDAITMETKMAPPIKENVPNINIALCKACGACVQACKTGSIHINAGSGEAHSEIDPDTCIRCGYCFRVCPTDAIKYGELIPKTVKGGKAIVVKQEMCIGCMTCKRVCPSMGAINVSKSSKLPYINPSYCARCEECMHSCPSGAIKYSSRKRAFATYRDTKNFDIVSEIVHKDMKKLSLNIISLNKALKNVATNLSMEFDDEPYQEFVNVKVNDLMEKELGLVLDTSIKVSKFNQLFSSYLFSRGINVIKRNCISCGACLNVCPTNAIKLTPPNPIIVDNNCIYCGLCIEECKFDAIQVYDDFFYSHDEGLFYARAYINGQRTGTLGISNKKCQLCTICVKNCPTEALKVEDDKISFNEDNCIYCRQCEQICPVDAIKIKIGDRIV